MIVIWRRKPTPDSPLLSCGLYRGLYSFLKNGDGNSFCAACFTGHYPVPVSDQGRTQQLVLFEAKER